MSRLDVVLAMMILWPGWLGAAGAPIEIKVEVTEIDHRKASSLGVEWTDSLSFQEASPAGLFEVGRFDRLTALQSKLHLLVEEGAAELLANPNLVTDSGTTATFHAGGEIPYVTSSSLGATHVEFKPYGVQVEITPLLLESGLIELALKASVSAPDQTNGVQVSGIQIPAILERTLTSNITLRPQMTVTLAGLLQTHQETAMSGVPVLRRIPLLGYLFKWQRRILRRTTIIMFVTPTVMTL